MTPGIWTHLGQRAQVWPGRNWPLGATWSPESTNFAVYSPNATECWVCVFDDDGVETRHQLTEQSLGIWHGALPDIAPGTRYGYRVDGPWDAGPGLPLQPPQAAARPVRAGHVAARSGPSRRCSATRWRDPTMRDEQDSAPYTARSVVVDPAFDWEGEVPMRRRWRDTVIYELHVKGFTKLHDRVPEELRGTYAGLGSPAVVEYLRDLGVTAVELLPVHQFFSEPALLERGLVELLGLQHDQLLLPRRRRTARPATAASRSPSSSRWSSRCTPPASR